MCEHIYIVHLQRANRMVSRHDQLLYDRNLVVTVGPAAVVGPCGIVLRVKVFSGMTTQAFLEGTKVYEDAQPYIRRYYPEYEGPHSLQSFAPPLPPPVAVLGGGTGAYVPSGPLPPAPASPSQLPLRGGIDAARAHLVQPLREFGAPGELEPYFLPLPAAQLQQPRFSPMSMLRVHSGGGGGGVGGAGAAPMSPGTYAAFMAGHEPEQQYLAMALQQPLIQGLPLEHRAGAARAAALQIEASLKAQYSSQARSLAAAAAQQMLQQALVAPSGAALPHVPGAALPSLTQQLAQAQAAQAMWQQQQAAQQAAQQAQHTVQQQAPQQAQQQLVQPRLALQMPQPPQMQPLQLAPTPGPQ